MTIEYEELYGSNYPLSQIEFQEAILEGWRIDENDLPHADLIGYSIKLVRNVAKEGMLEQAVVFPDVAPVKRVGRNKAV